jgi:AcrR family transcriptional regulator
MTASGAAPPSGPARRPGRPRDARADEVILAAAAEVLATGGPQRFTVDAVAAAAGVGKATIYRRWPTRADLLLAAVSLVGLEVPAPDTGNLRDDLVGLLVRLADEMANTPSGRLFLAVVGEAAVNEGMRSRLRAFVRERRQAAIAAIARAVARGELPDAIDPEELLDLLGAPIIVRLMTGGRVTDERFIAWTVDTVLTGVGYRPAGRTVPTPAPAPG